MKGSHQQNIWELQGSALNRQLRRAQAVKNVLRMHYPKTILDIGCAEGFITSFLADGQTLVVGIELDESIKIAKAKVKNAEFVHASMTHLPFKDECFDAVTVLEVLEHLPDNVLVEGVKEVDRILNREGKLLVSVPNNEQITYTRCIHCGKLTPLWGHLRSMSEEIVTNLLPENYSLTSKYTLPNLELISLSTVFRKLPFKIWFTVNNILGKIRKGYWLLLKYEKRYTL